MYCFVLIGICVGESLDLTSLAPEETVKIWPNFVALAFAQGVALRTSCLRMYISLVPDVGSVGHTLNRLAPFLSSPLRKSVALSHFLLKFAMKARQN